MHDYLQQFRLDGQVALVTGAARGLGAEIAEALASVGASVMLTDVLVAEGEAGAARLRTAGGDVANAVLYLASAASKWTTGAEIVVDGGASAA